MPESPKIILDLVNFINDNNQEKINFDFKQSYPYKDERFKIIKPIISNITIKKNQHDLKLFGKIETQILTNCDRCLKKTNLQIKFKFERLIANTLSGNDKNIIDEHNQINLFPIIWEEIISSIPSKILCKTTCRGICPVCGINLNQEKCSHRKKASPKPKSPFTVLKKLKKD